MFGLKREQLITTSGWRVQTGWELGEFSFLTKMHQDFHGFISLVGLESVRSHARLDAEHDYFLLEKEILNLTFCHFKVLAIQFFQGMKKWTLKNMLLGGGFRYFLFSPLPGEDSQFDQHFSYGVKPLTSVGICCCTKSLSPNGFAVIKVGVFSSILRQGPINGKKSNGEIRCLGPCGFQPIWLYQALQKPWENTLGVPAIGSVQVQCATVVVINISCNLLKPAPLCIDFECLGSDFPFFLEDKTPGKSQWNPPFRIGGYLGGMLDKPRCSGPQKNLRILQVVEITGHFYSEEASPNERFRITLLGPNIPTKVYLKIIFLFPR